MCGISAIISNNGFSFDVLKNMNDIIRHRGPDDEGFVCFDEKEKYIFAGKDSPEAVLKSLNLYSKGENHQVIPDKFKIGLGHRRLSIIDLSELGHQPMCDVTRRYWITYNGEIYNYLEIREELEDLGIKFLTETDTEVILEAYKYWGVNCQNKFNGMWAFIIYDSYSKEIFVSRDRFGIKPLYLYTLNGNEVFFSSEIKQFSTVPYWEAKLNHNAAYDYLAYALTDHEMTTMFEYVYRILPGNYIKTSINNQYFYSKPADLQIKWYEANDKIFKGNFEQATYEFRDYFNQAIDLHLRADVEVGSALSGGLDSSSIVSSINILLQKQGKSELQKTFSSCSNDKKFDEREWMDEIVSHTGVEAHFVYPDGKDVFSLTDKIIWHMDEPYQSQSVFLGYHVFQLAKNSGVKVLLNGQGADEYLSGYTDFRSLRLVNMFLKGKISEFIKETKNGGLLPTIKFLFANLLTRWNLKNSSLFRFKIFSHKITEDLINHSILKHDGQHLYAKLNYTKKTVKEISDHQINVEPLQKYLRWEDRNSMAHSIEARVPFLDFRLVEFTRSMPLDFLDGPDKNKKLLVASLKYILPDKIANRIDKKGFITPEERWFKHDYKSEFIELFRKNVKFSKGIINESETEKYLINIQKGDIPFDYTYWRVILFCIWMRIFDVKL